MFGVSYGSFALGFEINLWQCLLVGVVGVVLSFLLVGLVSLVGKRGSAPTMVLSRSAFGVGGNGLPSLVSYLILVVMGLDHPGPTVANGSGPSDHG